MPTKRLSKEKKDKILEQIQEEIDFARKHRQNKIDKSWKLNEQMYYGDKRIISTSGVTPRSSVFLPKGQGFVDTLLSKVDTPPAVKFEAGEESDQTRAENANAFLRQDSKPSTGNWAYKDLLAKKQAILYGRTIFEYHAESEDGYKSILSNVDSHNFLIDPSIGGLDIEEAFYMGRGNVFKTKEQIEGGIKSKKYLQREGRDLIMGGGDSEIEDEEKANEANRYAILLTEKERFIHDDNVYKFWEWYTTFEGKRYYVLYNESKGVAIRIEPIEEIFQSGKYPFITWATNPSLEEFWTPSPMDGVRDIFMAQIVSINQMIDNSEQRNNPLKGYDVNAIKNPNLLKWRRNGLIPFTTKSDLNTSVRVFETPEINTPLKVYEVLESISATESGVTPDAKGVSDEDRVGILESNIAQVADRLGLLNKSYSDAYHRLGLLYYEGVKEHMNEKKAIQMLGTGGIEFKEVSKSDIIASDHEYDIVITSSDAEQNSDIREQKGKIAFLQGYRGSPFLNPKKEFELGAEIVNFTPDQVRSLLDVDNFADSKLLEEASRDIKLLIEDKPIKPNRRANIAYMQKLVDYYADNAENMKPAIEARFIGYIGLIRSTVINNTVRTANEVVAKEAKEQQTGRVRKVNPEDVVEGEPVNNPLEVNQ
tara:strand:+ start:3224 stop:5173 length:1950 start_codon:yes stop_codon:yes gene_type:complete